MSRRTAVVTGGASGIGEAAQGRPPRYAASYIIGVNGGRNT
jgi:NAD(P)-dependent dehydrogenase (short-subunit alcohol dehydrogenase family)